MKTFCFYHLFYPAESAVVILFSWTQAAFLVCLLSLSSAFAAAPAPSRAPATNSISQGRDFAAFKIIYERNIFNPNRRANSRQNQPGDEPKPVRIETITLTGTMQSDGELYAFFDGSESRYKTALKQKQTIANLTLVEIQHDRVKFTSASNSWDVPMLMQLRREDNGDWRLKESPSFISNNSSSPGFGSSSGDTAIDPEALKRLLKKREEEEGGNASSGSTASNSEGPKPEVTQKSEMKEPEKSANSTSVSSTSSSSASASSTDDALKRLLQRREQE